MSEKLDIVAVVEFYGCSVPLTGGRSSKVRCFLPGHDDTTPSAVVYTDKHYYRCFTCDASLDGVDVIKRMEGLDFNGAIAFGAEHPEFGGGQLSQSVAEPGRRATLRISDRGARPVAGNNPAVQAGMRPRRKRLS